MLLPKELKKKPTLKCNPGLALVSDTGEQQVTWSFKIIRDINQCEKEKNNNIIEKYKMQYSQWKNKIYTTSAV